MGQAGRKTFLQPSPWGTKKTFHRELEHFMLSFILRRLAISVVIVLGVSAITFGMLHLISPSPAYTVLPNATPEQYDAWNEEHGFNRPFIIQYLDYLWGVLHLDFGHSFTLNQSISELFAQKAGKSLYLSGMSLVLALLIAIPLGIWQALKRGTVGDHILTGWNFTLYSMPSFFLGLVLIQVFSINLGILPSYVSSQVNSAQAAFLNPIQMLLPIVTLALISVASFSRYMRSSALNVLASDYIRVARAKGLSERLILSRHLLRNACLPIITLLGMSIPGLVAGNLITEVLFNYPGLGLLFFNALARDDYYVLLAYTLLGALLTVIGNLVADVALSLADPRIRLEK